MRRRPPIAVLGVLVVSLLGLAVFSAAMMGSMMGSMMGDGHWRMMGGRGSDPGDEAPVAGVTEVRLEDFAFAPANIVVDVGTTVTWTNYDGVDHTVTSDDGRFASSDPMRIDQQYIQAFPEPGTFLYYCTFHPEDMQGSITVS